MAAATGNPFTITALVTALVQVPLLYKYFTNTDPADKPVTIPLIAIDAVPVPFVTDHIPPAVECVNAGVIELMHTPEAPPAIVSNTGKAFTTIVLLSVFIQLPLFIVYVTVADPAVMPVNMPAAEMEA